MSKIIEREAKMVETVISRIVGYKCDFCGKEIEKIKYGQGSVDRGYEVKTGHYDWGNDSIDSIRYEHICDKCLQAHLKKYYEYNYENKDDIFFTSRYYKIKPLKEANE